MDIERHQCPAKLTIGKLLNMHEWFQQYVGLGKRYDSLWAMSLAAGLSGPTAGQIYRRGTGKAETLVKLAKLVEEDPVKLLVIAGILPEESLR